MRYRRAQVRGLVLNAIGRTVRRHAGYRHRRESQWRRLTPPVPRRRSAAGKAGRAAGWTPLARGWRSPARRPRPARSRRPRGRTCGRPRGHRALFARRGQPADELPERIGWCLLAGRRCDGSAGQHAVERSAGRERAGPRPARHGAIPGRSSFQHTAGAHQGLRAPEPQAARCVLAARLTIGRTTPSRLTRRGRSVRALGPRDRVPAGCGIAC